MVDAPAVHIFNYLDHRELLRDLFAAKKAQGRGFSHRAFARKAGLRSTNYLQLVMTGKRNLSPAMAARFAAAFGLEREAAGYFCDLVAFNSAKTASERARSHERLMRFRRFRAVHKLGAHTARYHEHWYLPAVRELVRSKYFKDDPRWIASQLLPRITAAQARAALETLQALGLLQRDASGRLQQTEALVMTGPGPLNHHIVNYHRSMLTRASEAMDHVPREEREISSLTLCTSQASLLELKQRILQFKAELLQRAEQQGEPERVVQLNFQLFPLSVYVEDDHD